MKKISKILLVTIGLLLSVIVISPNNNVYAKEDSNVKIESFADKRIRGEIKKYDENNDGYLDNEELKKVTTLVFFDEEGRTFNLKDIGKLKYLEKLSIDIDEEDYTNKIKNVKEIYKLSNLKELRLGYCKFEKNIKLNFKSLKKLKKLDLHVLSKVKSVDVSKNKKLEHISVGVKGIKKLNLTKNKKLKEISVCGNKTLKTINLKKNKKLEKLALAKIKSKYSLKYNKNLKNLEVILTEVPDISKNKKLKNLYIYNPDNEEISIGSGNKNLKNLSIIRNKKMKVSIDGCKKLKMLEISGGSADIKITNCGKIRYFEIFYCSVENLECDVAQDVYMLDVNITEEELKESKVNLVKR